MNTQLEVLVGEKLKQFGLKLAVAESCTGGLIGHRVTNIPGASEYYLGSVTAYAYEAKERLLGVQHTTLLEHGAVSRETVLEMARGVRRALGGDEEFNTTVGLSVSGIAGPGGGMPGKPVGLVWVGLSLPEGDQAREFYEIGNRIENKEASSDHALELLLAALGGVLPPAEALHSPALPRSFQWRGSEHVIEDVGRRWTDARGEHVLVRAKGRTFDLFYNPSQPGWQVRLVSRTQPV